jgi:hypothetical protein
MFPGFSYLPHLKDFGIQSPMTSDLTKKHQENPKQQQQQDYRGIESRDEGRFFHNEKTVESVSSHNF